MSGSLVVGMGICKGKDACWLAGLLACLPVEK